MGSETGRELLDDRASTRAVSSTAESSSETPRGMGVGPGALGAELRGEAVGTLNLFHQQAGVLPEADLALGQALTDVANIGILQERAIRRGEEINEQLQAALNDRIIIEQAKGLLAHLGELSTDAAFDRLRRYARHNNLRLSEVARQVVLTDLADDILATTTTPTRTTSPRGSDD